MFYLALRYFISYLSYALLVKALSSGIVPGVDTPILLPGRDTAFAALFMAVGIGTTTLSFTFVGASIVFALLLMRAGVLILSPVVDAALAPDVADRTHCLAGSDVPEPSATSLDDHRRTAVLIQQAAQQRLAKQFT